MEYKTQQGSDELKRVTAVISYGVFNQRLHADGPEF